jgi:capsular polysaccharide transport system ATP-binding protein
MLSIKNLTKSYKIKSGRKYIFKDISIDFPENQNVGILGPNGAGKSTLLRIIGGIDHPDSGTIECNKTISWPLGLRGGFISTLSARENCRVIFRLYNIPFHEIRKKLDYIKEISGIGDYFEEPVKYFSTGMSSRIGFALSMSFDFEILLMDEITAVGDQEFQNLAKDILDEKRNRMNIIFVSHSLVSMKKFCDSGILLDNGKFQYFPKIEDAINSYAKRNPRL